MMYFVVFVMVLALIGLVFIMRKDLKATAAKNRTNYEVMNNSITTTQVTMAQVAEKIEILSGGQKPSAPVQMLKELIENAKSALPTTINIKAWEGYFKKQAGVYSHFHKMLETIKTTPQKESAQSLQQLILDYDLQAQFLASHILEYNRTSKLINKQLSSFPANIIGPLNRVFYRPLFDEVPFANYIPKQTYESAAKIINDDRYFPDKKDKEGQEYATIDKEYL